MSDAAAFYVIVRGPIGVGKTEVARRLARVLGALYISVDRILDRHRLERWRNGFIAQASFRRSNVFVARAAAPVLAAGRPVVVDGNFYWESQIEDLARRIRRPHLVASLDAPLRVCIARERGRGSNFGVADVTAVYRKAMTVTAGVPIDARGPVSSIVASIRALLPPQAPLESGATKLRPPRVRKPALARSAVGAGAPGPRSNRRRPSLRRRR
ncbi:MAG TPA: AAA family ATPase [Thermoplasmata archaeon]|nr:AAA family ATPase [Thermoplasmata archaeon]